MSQTCFAQRVFNTVEVALSTAGAIAVRPEARKSAADIRDIYAAPELSLAAREAYIATLRRIARGIDVDAEAHELHAKELAALGLAENQVVIFMVTDGQRVAAAESIAQGVATTVLTLGWFTAWSESGFLPWPPPLTPPVQSPGTATVSVFCIGSRRL